MSAESRYPYRRCVVHPVHEIAGRGLSWSMSMTREPMGAGEPLATAHDSAIVIGLLGALLVASGTATMAQEDKLSPNAPEERNATVLSGEFARQLSNAELNWPDAVGIAAAEKKDTRSARSDACMWQEIILREPFAAASWVGGDKGDAFTAGVSAGGYDSVYYRWETEDYALQFRCSQWMISIVLEPKFSAARVELSERDVGRRTADIVARVINCGPQLLANSTIRLEPTDYGYRVYFERTARQVEALRRQTAGCNLGAGHEWLASLNIHTDGRSFVFDVVKIGATAPTKPVTTTQPGERSWFKERKPPEPANP